MFVFKSVVLCEQKFCEQTVREVPRDFFLLQKEYLQDFLCDLGLRILCSFVFMLDIIFKNGCVSSSTGNGFSSEVEPASSFKFLHFILFLDPLPIPLCNHVDCHSEDFELKRAYLNFPLESRDRDN